MSDPYRIDPKTFEQRRRTVQEEQMVTLRDDNVRLPPTVGPNLTMSLILGPAVGQPQGALSRPRRSWGQRLLTFLIWSVAGLVSLSILLRWIVSLLR